MRIFQVLGLAMGAFLVMGCVSFPTKQLSFDLTDEPMPVMLTPVENPGVTKKIELDAGYSSISATSSETENETTVTNSISMEGNNGRPLSEQLQNRFIQAPLWFEVSDLHLETHRFVLLLLASNIDKLNYVTHVSLEAPYQPYRDGQK
ncbi:MAG: hypothetical protein HKM05_10240 [Spirochaetales bacterium]|nr:hypothetical protein [Spirochaetales bacterium]